MTALLALGVVWLCVGSAAAAYGVGRLHGLDDCRQEAETHA